MSDDENRAQVYFNKQRYFIESMSDEKLAALRNDIQAAMNKTSRRIDHEKEKQAKGEKIDLNWLNRAKEFNRAMNRNLRQISEEFSSRKARSRSVSDHFLDVAREYAEAGRIDRDIFDNMFNEAKKRKTGVA